MSKPKALDEQLDELIAVGDMGAFLSATSDPNSPLSRKIQDKIFADELFHHDLLEKTVKANWIFIQDQVFREKMAERDQAFRDFIKDEIAKAEALRIEADQREYDKQNKAILISEKVDGLETFILELMNQNEKLEKEISRWASDIPGLQQEFKNKWDDIQEAKSVEFQRNVSKIGGLRDFNDDVVAVATLVEAIQRPALLDVVKVNSMLEAKITDHVTDMTSAEKMANQICNGDNCFRQLNVIGAIAAIPDKNAAKKEEMQSNIETENVGLKMLAIMRKQKANLIAAMANSSLVHRQEVENVQNQILTKKPDIKIKALKAQQYENMNQIDKAKAQIERLYTQSQTQHKQKGP